MAAAGQEDNRASSRDLEETRVRRIVRRWAMCRPPGIGRKWSVREATRAWAIGADSRSSGPRVVVDGSRVRHRDNRAAAGHPAESLTEEAKENRI